MTVLVKDKRINSSGLQPQLPKLYIFYTIFIRKIHSDSEENLLHSKENNLIRFHHWIDQVGYLGSCTDYKIIKVKEQTSKDCPVERADRMASSGHLPSEKVEAHEMAASQKWGI